MVKTKEEQWNEMEFSEKLKWNGHKGFCNGELFSDNNAFMSEDKARLKKRLVKEKTRINKLVGKN